MISTPALSVAENAARNDAICSLGSRGAGAPPHIDAAVIPIISTQSSSGTFCSNIVFMIERASTFATSFFFLKSIVPICFVLLVGNNP